MKAIAPILAVLLLTGGAAVGVAAQERDPLFGGIRLRGDARTAAGLREALEIGTGKAVDLTGRLDGYFRNQAIKILVPRQLRTVEKVLRTVGEGEKVDAFVLAMNRAAEKAAPEAKSIFKEAIRELTFDDVRRIVTSRDAAATEYFKEKCTARLTTAFRPIVARSMNEEKVTQQYRRLMSQVPELPFGGRPTFDLEKYVVSEAMDGLFYMVAQEELKIRKDPAARVTDLLKDVFGRR